LAAAKRLAALDHTIWGEPAQAEASVRLGWVNLPTASKELLPQLSDLRDWAAKRQLSHLILCGMGGSSLAPEVFAKSFAKELVILDTTDADQIRAAIPADLRHTAIIVGSKSGSTIETASQKALFTALLLEQNLTPADHFVIITDPESPFDKSARADGLKVINADPNVGGRFSALSAFGLVPAALMGIDVAQILDQAASAAATFISDQSPAVLLAAAIHSLGAQNLAFSDAGSNVPGLADWIEQLIAESTGKEGKGYLPIAVNSQAVAGASTNITFNIADENLLFPNLVVEAELAEHFILWEWVTSLISVPLQINPFDQPNVTEAKVRAMAQLEAWGKGEPDAPPVFSDELFEVHSNIEGVTDLASAISAIIQESGHYVAIMAYLDRWANSEAAELRNLIAKASGKGTTFGWGPRFLHSTGQYHKGGPKGGAFLQITGDCLEDIAIPDREFTFHTLQMAQAIGDGLALTSRNLPTVRIHLKDRKAGLRHLIALLKK
jgi:glucose-6-phosphate isomerase